MRTVDASDPASTAPGDHDFVATGRTSRGMSISTGADAVAVFVLLPENEAELVRTVPSEIVVSSGTRMATWTLRVASSGRPTEPAGLGGLVSGMTKAMVNRRVPESYVTVCSLVDCGKLVTSRPAGRVSVIVASTQETVRPEQPTVNV